MEEKILSRNSYIFMVNWFSTKVPSSVNEKIIVLVTTGTRTIDNPYGKKERKQKKNQSTRPILYKYT